MKKRSANRTNHEATDESKENDMARAKHAARSNASAEETWLQGHFYSATAAQLSTLEYRQDVRDGTRDQKPSEEQKSRCGVWTVFKRMKP